MKTLKEQSTEYYRDQLAKIPAGKAGTYAPQIKLTQCVNSGNPAQSVSTNWFGLNDESATELYNFLRTHYNINTEENRHLFKITYGWDKNQHRTIRIYSERFKQGVTIPKEYKSPNLSDRENDNLRDSVAVARQWLIDHGYSIAGYAESRSSDYDFLISDTFKPLRDAN